MQGAVVAIGGQQNILGPHGAGDADRYRLLPERDGVGAEPPGALQRDRLEVEGTGQDHGPVEGPQRLEVGGEIRQLAENGAVRRQAGAPVHLEARDHGEACVCHRVLNLVDQYSRGRHRLLRASLHLSAHACQCRRLTLLNRCPRPRGRCRRRAGACGPGRPASWSRRRCRWRSRTGGSARAARRGRSGRPGRCGA